MIVLEQHIVDRNGDGAISMEESQTMAEEMKKHMEQMRQQQGNILGGIFWGHRNILKEYSEEYSGDTIPIYLYPSLARVFSSANPLAQAVFPPIAQSRHLPVGARFVRAARNPA